MRKDSVQKLINVRYVFQIISLTNFGEQNVISDYNIYNLKSHSASNYLLFIAKKYVIEDKIYFTKRF